MTKSLDKRSKRIAPVATSSRLTLCSDLYDLYDLRRSSKAMEDLLRQRKTLVDIIESRAERHPAQPCLLYREEMYTYAEVAWNVNRTARWVSGSNPSLKQGDVVCILLHNGPTLVWTWLGLMKLGVITSMLNYNLRGEVLLHCIRASEAKKIILGSELLGVIADISQKLDEMKINLWLINDARTPGLVVPENMVTMDIASVSGEHYPTARPSDMSNVVCYIFTSGTTGMPKPAINTYTRLLKVRFLFLRRTGVGPSDVIYVSLPMFHSSSLTIAVVGGLMRGATIAIAKTFSASRFWDDVRRYKATIIQYIGETCRYLLAQPERDTDGQYERPIRAAIGNGLQLDIWEKFRSRFNIGHIYEFYGATDGAFSCMNTYDDVGSVGRYSWLFKRVSDALEIVDYDPETSEVRRGPDGFCIRLPPGQAGLMLVNLSGGRSFAGYKGPGDLTLRKIVRDVKTVGDSYFNTGDLMRIDAKGHIFFVDRLGDTFRWKGENVSTLEVSQVLSQFPAIKEANVYGVKLPGHDGRAGMAAIIFHDDAGRDFPALYEHVASALPDYAQPKFLRLVREMELTHTYKMRKVELVRKGIGPDEDSEVYVIDHSQKTYVPINHDHVRMITSGQSKL